MIGHADRSGPLRDYCTGLMYLASAKVSSRWQHGRRRREQRRNTSHCCILSALRLVG